jgi:hypothetical protein
VRETGTGREGIETELSVIKNGTRIGSGLELLTRSPESEELARRDSRTVCKVKYIEVLN